MARRFSLFSLFVVTTMLALAVSCVVLGVRLRKMERLATTADERARRLEVDLGIVGQGDPQRLQVLSIRQMKALCWKWRVRRPPGSWIDVCHKTGLVGAKGIAEPDGQHKSSPDGMSGEVVEVEVQVYRNPEHKWMLSVRLGAGVSTSIFNEQSQEWLNGDPSLTSSTAGQGVTEEYDLDTPVVLLRTREVPPPSGPSHSRELLWPDDAAESQGILVWIVGAMVP